MKVYKTKNRIKDIAVQFTDFCLMKYVSFVIDFFHGVNKY